MRPKGLQEARGPARQVGRLETYSASLEFLFGLSSFPPGTFIIFVGPLGTRKKNSPIQLVLAWPDWTRLYFVYFSWC